jgi:hypothetical protein
MSNATMEASKLQFVNDFLRVGDPHARARIEASIQSRFTEDTMCHVIQRIIHCLDIRFKVAVVPDSSAASIVERRKFHLKSLKKFQSKLVSNIDFIQGYTEGFQNLWTARFQFQKRNGVKLLEEAIKFLSDVIEIE